MNAPASVASLVIAATIVAAGGCSPNAPSESLAGTWTARGIGHSGLMFTLSLEQSGRRISGTACGTDSGVVLFRGAPVHGTWPQVSFVITPDSTGACCLHAVGQSFSGRQDDTHDIVGRSDFGSDLRFERGAPPAC